MRFRQGDPGYGWWWEATSPAAESKIRARAAAALYFLDRFAGGDSQWMVRGRAAFEENSHSMETGARELGDVLREWADQVEAGIVPIRQVDAQGARAVASSDLMDQVQVLMSERDIHPAAPIVIAGAALEVALRSAIEELDLPRPPKPSISSYTGALRSAGLLSVQDVKDVEQMGGLRNAAAHGNVKDLDAERAELMERQVDRFLRRLEHALLDHRRSKQSGLTGDTDLTSESDIAGDDLSVVKSSRGTRDDRRRRGPQARAAYPGRPGGHFPRTGERPG
jgi:hypothetical protein